MDPAHSGGAIEEGSDEDLSPDALVRQNYELRLRLEEAADYKKRLDKYRQAQQHQAALVSRLQAKVSGVPLLKISLLRRDRRTSHHITDNNNRRCCIAGVAVQTEMLRAGESDGRDDPVRHWQASDRRGVLHFGVGSCSSDTSRHTRGANPRSGHRPEETRRGTAKVD